MPTNLCFYACSFLLFLLVFSIICNQHLEIKLNKSRTEISDLTTRLTDQNNAISQLVIAQHEKAMEVNKAQNDVLKLKKQYDKGAKTILAEKIPHQCNKAIKWGADQGAIAYRCWPVEC